MNSVRFTSLAMVTALAAGGLTAAPAHAGSGNLLKNPGFEKSLTSNAWKGQDCCVTTSDPHSGEWIAWMGGEGVAHTDKIKQRVSIPQADKATLSFWVKISTEVAGEMDDTFKVRVTKPDGTTRTIKSLSSADATGTYVKYTASMSRYTGKKVVVAFVVVEDQGDRTDFQLDDTALKTS